LLASLRASAYECFDADCNILSGVTDRTVFSYLDYFPVIFNLHGQGEMKAGFLSARKSVTLSETLSFEN